MRAPLQHAPARRSPGSARAAVLSMLIGFLSLPASLCAEDKIPMPQLASPMDEAPSGTAISSGNVDDFLEILPPEAAQLVRDGRLTLSAFKAAPLDLSRAELASGGASALSLTEHGALAAPAKINGALFGKEVAAEQSVARTLWNSAARLARYVRVQGVISAAARHARGPETGYQLAFERIHPLQFRADDKTGQLFRERFVVQRPGALSGLTWLTFRFAGEDEDVVWVFSPAIHKVRQITGTNRSDNFLDTAFRPDDLLGWSGKVDQFDQGSIHEVPVLMPLESFEIVPAAEKDGCFVPQIKAAQNEAPPLKNKQQESSYTGVLRAAYRLEGVPRDPYVQNGREVLYLDKQLLVPLYRVLYDRTGKVISVEIVSHRITLLGKELEIVPARQEIFHLEPSEQTVLTYDQIKLCNAGTPDFASFDPSHLGAAPQPSPGAVATAAVTVQPTVVGTTVPLEQASVIPEAVASLDVDD